MQNTIEANDNANRVINPVPPTRSDTMVVALDEDVVAEAME